MKVRLNLATAPLENQRRFVLGAGLTGGFALVLLVVLSMQVYSNWRSSSEVRAEAAALQADLAKFAAERRALEEFFDTPQARGVRGRADFLNALIQQRSFPWTGIFQNLEDQLPAGVRIASISPKMHDGQVEVRLMVGANSDENKVKFLRALEESEEFSRVQVMSENRALATESDKVLLEVMAWYKTTQPPAAASEPQTARSGPGGVR